MGRPSKKTLYIRALLKEIETDPSWREIREALYKEYILNLLNGEPRWIYSTLIQQATSYFDYMTTEVDPTLTVEELITDELFLDTPVITKTMEALKDKEVFPRYGA